jgi:hypothetical protein
MVKRDWNMRRYVQAKNFAQMRYFQIALFVLFGAAPFNKTIQSH